MRPPFPIRFFAVLLVSFLSFTTSYSQTAAPDSAIRINTNRKPAFNGDINTYLAERLRYPDFAALHGITGKVVVRFAVDTDGTVKDAEIVKSVHFSLDTEALRVVREMPRWIPAARRDERQNLVPVRVLITLPVSFNRK